ncbi:MAG: hypothetical protein ACK5KU_11480 [Beutenbergiaceae bacterium]
MIALATAIVWLWLGMVLAISFLEAPLKFRAPGITIPLGLGIGRLIFRALNTVETALALVLVVALIFGSASLTTIVAAGTAMAMLLAQIVAVRPRLSKRADTVLAGGPHDKRSHAHLWYVGLEVIKAAALIVAGLTLLA